MKLLAGLVSLVMIIVIVITGCGPSSAPPPAASKAPVASQPAAPASSAAPSSAAAAPARVYQLKLHDQMAPTQYLNARVIMPWAAQMEKQTEGRLKITVFPSEQLGKQSEAYDLVFNGTADIALVIPNTQMGRFPMTDFSTLPFLVPPMGDPTRRPVLDVLFSKYYFPVYFKDSVKLLWTGAFTGMDLHNVRKAVRVPEDAKGMVVGFSGGSAVSDVLKAAGIAPQVVLPQDIYTTLERRTIDGCMQSVETLVSLKLSEVSKFVTLLSAGTGAYGMMMNQKSWGNLPPDLQKALTDSLPAAVKMQDEAGAGVIDAALAAAKKSGVEVIDPNAAEKAKWMALAKPTIDTWIKGMDDKGLPASAMLADVNKAAGR